MLLLPSRAINPDPVDMIWHYVNGQIPCYLSDDNDEVGWVKNAHRGVQFLDKIDFPRKEKRYIFSPKFQVKYNRAFEECLKGCQEQVRDRKTWITDEVYQGYMNMHRLGYCHSFETWQDGQLVGGAIGVQIGGYVSCETMFHRVSNASKAAYGQTIVHLQQRGFKWIDTNCVAGHHVNYGEEWVPQWKFHQMTRDALNQTPSLGDEFPCSPIPWRVKYGLPVARAVNAVGRRLRFKAATM